MCFSLLAHVPPKYCPPEDVIYSYTRRHCSKSSADQLKNKCHTRVPTLAKSFSKINSQLLDGTCCMEFNFTDFDGMRPVLSTMILLDNRQIKSALEQEMIEYLCRRYCFEQKQTDVFLVRTPPLIESDTPYLEDKA